MCKSMEIELRARVKNQEELEKKLSALAGIKEKDGGGRQVDVYLKHEKDAERKLVVRIRKNYQEDKAILTFKGSPPKDKDDTAWHDFDVEINNPDDLERLLTNNGFVYVCIIDKVRQSFAFKDFEINIDNIRDLGLFIEVEKKAGEEEIENVKNEISALLEQVGIGEKDLVKKGYVPLMLEYIESRDK